METKTGKMDEIESAANAGDWAAVNKFSNWDEASRSNGGFPRGSLMSELAYCLFWESMTAAHGPCGGGPHAVVQERTEAARERSLKIVQRMRRELNKGADAVAWRDISL